MPLPTIVARSNGDATPQVSAPQRVPSHNDWVAAYSELERLYVRERRKLRFIMRYMETKRNFKATENMYKKRFTRWNFQKNARRRKKSLDQSTSETVDGRCIEMLVLVPTSPKLGQDDSLKLGFLVTAQQWSVSYFEAARPSDGCRLRSERQIQRQQSCCESARRASFTVKLVSDLLDRGHGALAGRMARKTFLLVEDILTLEEPVVIWNLLDILYHVVKVRHNQLFHILLSHLIALAERRMSKAHPLAVMLHQLRRLVTSLGGHASTTSSSSLRPPSASSWKSGKDTTTSSRISLFSGAISDVIEQAWAANAEIIFNRFDPQFFHLYRYLHWESCPIDFPPAMWTITKQWLSYMEVQPSYSSSIDAPPADDVQPKTFRGKEKTMIPNLLAPRLDSSPPQDYDMLCMTGISALEGYCHNALIDGSAPTSQAATTLRVLPALIKAGVAARSGMTGNKSRKVSRSQAGNVACVLKALMDVEAQQRGLQLVSVTSSVDRLRSILALREYVHGETDPHVMQEMWLLEDAFTEAGHFQKAQETKRSVLSRLERYVEDVPLDSI